MHPALCNVSGVEEHIRTQGRGKYCAFATSPLTDGGTEIDPSIAPQMPGLSAVDADSARHILIYPNVFMSIYPHHCFRVILEPLTAGVTHERTQVLVHPSIYELPDAEAKIDGFMAFHTHVNWEDMGICEVRRASHDDRTSAHQRHESAISEPSVSPGTMMVGFPNTTRAQSRRRALSEWAT